MLLMNKKTFKKPYKWIILGAVCIAIGVTTFLVVNNSKKEIINEVVGGTERMQVIVNAAFYTGGPCDHYIFMEDGESTSKCVNIDIEDAMKLAGYDDYYKAIGEGRVEYLKLDVDAYKKIETLTGSTEEPQYKDYETFTVEKIYSAEVYKP